MGVDGVDDTVGAAEKAANDEAADTSRYGIPLTQTEIALVEQSLGGVDGTIGPTGLVAAHPDILNTLWLEGNTLTISVLRSDAAVLELAQCLERGDFVGRVRYVSAGIPAAELSALGDRIHADRDGLAREGIAVTVVSSDPKTETVHVGVADLVEGTAARLIERYGTVVETIETAGPQPLLPRSHQPLGPGS